MKKDNTAQVSGVKQRSLWQDAWRRFKKNKLAMVGLVFLAILVLIAVGTIVVDLVTNNYIYENYVIKQNLRGRLEPPSLEHPFGLDEFGRDMLLRMLWAVRSSLFMGVIAIIISGILGGLLGAAAGYYGKTTDNVIMRFMDILMAVPGMLLAIAIAASLGPGLRNMMIAIGIGNVWKFPYITGVNGGGWFVLFYLIFLFASLYADATQIFFPCLSRLHHCIIKG